MIVITVVLVGLFLYPRLTAPKVNGNSGGYGAPCLVSNLPLLQHIHPELTIEVDGKEEVIPQNIGLGACERALHTHDEVGIIHTEAQDKREYRLGDFFAVWNKPIERDGYALEITADGVAIQDPANLFFKDGQKIVMKYAKLENSK